MVVALSVVAPSTGLKMFRISYLLLLFSLYTFAEFAEPPEKIPSTTHSLKGPFGGSHIPFWETGGSTVVMDNYIQLTPDKRSQQGYLWNTKMVHYSDWQVRLYFSVGGDQRVGADGMAFWYTKEPRAQGNVFGYKDTWRGLGVIFDTFDNDGQRDNPVIYAVYNDGSFSFNAASDGKQKILGSCRVDFRQSSSAPHEKVSLAKIQYYNNELSVFYDLSGQHSATPSGWVQCFTAKLIIPEPERGYFIGVTAETGGLYDFHSVKQINTWKLKDPRKSKYEKDETEEYTRPPENYRESIKKYAPKSDETKTIEERVIDLEKSDSGLAESIQDRFKTLEEKILSLDQSSALRHFQESVDEIKTNLDWNKNQELENQLKEVLKMLSTLNDRINQIQEQMEGTSKRTLDFTRNQEERHGRLHELVESSSKWGFWTYFLIFQVFFWVAFVWWKRSHDEKNKKFL